MDASTQQDRLYRKQFFFGVSQFPGEKWNTHKMPRGYCLSTHPDLTVTQHTGNNFEITLLGFVLDPENPEAGNGQILARLCSSAKSIPELIEATENLSGRWILFLYHQDSAVVLTDAGGMRSVYYYQDGNGNLWLASQPGLFVQVFGLSASEEAQRFMESPGYTRRIENWWPGDRTPYTDVKHLLPNHLINLVDSSVVRYWPVKPLQKISLEDGVRLAGSIMKGTLASAHHRFPLAMSLSSGYDSRVVFSGCKEFAREVFLFSLQYRHLNLESDDIRIPREIAQATELTHHLIDCRSPISSEFADLYTRNVTAGMKNDWGSIAEARLNQIPGDPMVLKGSISEIVRCRYWGLGVYPYRVTLRDLVRLLNLGDDPLVISSLRDWMIDALPAERLGYKLLDLFSWEIEIGNWMGLAPLYFDISQEEFSPFDNRKFITIMLGVDPRYRSYPEHKMEREIVAYLWPELSKFPYTPSRHIPQKRFLEGPILNSLRWVKYLLTEEKHGRLE